MLFATEMDEWIRNYKPHFGLKSVLKTLEILAVSYTPVKENAVLFVYVRY
jgi:hypothetical protein